MAAPATLPALLASLTQSLTLTQEATPTIATVQHQKDGISLLDVKNELLLSYLQNLVFLILLKIRNAKKTDSEADSSEIDESVREKLVELKLFLERGARPLEEKLRFSIERFLRAATDAQREEKEKQHRLENGSDDDDEDEDDDEDDEGGEEEDPLGKPLAQRRGGKYSSAPRFGTMVNDVTARPALRDAGAASGLYKAPKRERQVMDPERKTKTERRPNKSRTMDEFVNSELSAAPMAEPSIGTTIVQGGRRMKTQDERKDEDERRNYEESNFVRLPQVSKKDKAQKAKQAGRAAMQFGGEEWHDLGQGIDRIDRLTKGKKVSNVRALLDKSRKRGRDTTDGPRASGHQDMGDSFRKKVKMLDAGRRDRGKNR